MNRYILSHPYFPSVCISLFRRRKQFHEQYSVCSSSLAGVWLLAHSTSFLVMRALLYSPENLPWWGRWGGYLANFMKVDRAEREEFELVSLQCASSLNRVNSLVWKANTFARKPPTTIKMATAISFMVPCRQPAVDDYLFYCCVRRRDLKNSD